MTEMNHNQIANSACDAFDIIANSVINRATFDKTIIGVIVSCADAELGQYKVLYQDAHYYATVSNTEDSYSTGDNVYILIPENDLTKPKKILGAVENLGDNYLAQTNIDSQFDTIGENAITVENNYINDFSYCSYKGEEYEVLYDVNNIENNKININTMAFAGSARSAEKLQITAKIKTLIPAEQLNGNFGLKVDIETYIDLETEDTVIKTYILDINSMVGTIYNLSNYLTQSTLLDFNGSMFKRITKITAFIKDFQKDNDKINMDDIYISDIGIFAMISADEKSWNTYYLTLETPNGVSLSKSLTNLALNARVVYKNREVSNSKLNYYWFLKDMSISKTSDKYCVHGGQGWYCLNEYKDDKWVPANSSYNISNTKMLGSSAEYKCVAVLDDIAIAYNQKTIYNEDAEYIVDMDVLDLPSKTFYANQGTASLVCNVQYHTQEEISNIDDFIFHWGRLDSQGNYLDFDAENGSSEQIINDIINPLTNAKLLKKTKTLLTHMETILSQNAELRKDYFFSTSRFEDEDKELTYFNIKNILETVFNMKYGGIITKKYKNEQVLRKIQEFIDSQKVLSCVVKNIFHNLKASIINERNTFTCTVYKIDQNTGEELYIGTDSLIISNLISPANATYKINLINKNQVFKYNESGKSPTHHTYESPQEILPLSFELFDNNNTKIDLSQSQSAVVRWYIPIEDTLLILPEGIDEEKKSIDDTNTYYIINDSTLSFEIADTYDMNKRNNNILLEVIYNTFNEKISTNFSFFKEGFMGTNGSDYFCRIVPNHITNNYPTLYCYNNENNEFKVESNFTGGEENINNGEIPWFSVELWDGGEQLDLSMANIEWKILTNGKETPLEILDKSNQNIFIQLNEDIFKEILNENISPCLVIQASVFYAGKKYFATQPLAISYSQGAELKYKLNIKAKTGFNEAVYSNDGVNPQFNSATPFEAEVLLVDSINITDDNNTVIITDLNITAIETENDEYQTPLAFDWAVFKNSALKTKKALNALDYQIKCQPPDIYDGLNVSNGIILKIGKRDINGKLKTEYQRLYFPIHLYLNRYGHSHLNEWDGNSIQISEEEGYILSPQMGAGKKNYDNTFTGMLMGEVKGGLKNKTGLLGYGHGIQTMFLDAETGSAYFGKNEEIAIEPKNEDTQIKLGTWYLDKEAIWQSSDGTKIFGGDDPYYNPINPDDAKNIYFGQKGLSLDNKLVFFNQGVRAEEEDENFITIDNIKYKSERGPGTLKIGPWIVENTAFWKGSNYLGGRYQKWLDEGGEEASGIGVKPDPPLELPKEPQKPSSGTNLTNAENNYWKDFKSTYLEIFEEKGWNGLYNRLNAINTTAEIKKFANGENTPAKPDPDEYEGGTNNEDYQNATTRYEYWMDLIDLYNTEIKDIREDWALYDIEKAQYDAAVTFYNNSNYPGANAQEKYKEALNIYKTALDEYFSDATGVKTEGLTDIYLGNSGFSLSNAFRYNSKDGQLSMDGILLNTDSTMVKTLDSIVEMDSFLKIYMKAADNQANALTLENKDKTVMGTFLAPNKLFFFDRLNNTSYSQGTISFIAGKGSYYGNIATSGTRKNGNTFYFDTGVSSRTGFHLSPANVRIITYGTASDKYGYVAFGATKVDAQGGGYSAAENLRHTYLRGRTLYLQAFGSSASSYNGSFYAYVGRFRFYNYSKYRPYVSKSWTTSSDERAKNLKILDDRYYDFFKKLKPYGYTWKDDKNGALNIGYSAQQVKQALFDSGLELKDFGGLTIEYDEEMDKKYGIKDFHSLSYTDFGPIQTMVLQKALEKIDELEERIKELEK